ISLKFDNFVTWQSSSSHQDDKRNIFRSNGCHRCDHAALAVSDQANFSGIDLLAVFEELHACQHVTRIVFAGCREGAKSRSTHAAVVNTEYSNTKSRQVVGQNHEGSVTGNRLISILCSGTSDEHNGRERSLGPWDR